MIWIYAPNKNQHIANLVEYALVRDLYRDYKKELITNMQKEFAK
ncbi:hypothetical protein [Paraclostridium sordellii]|nr:hypothetical protein [Paeniclostridium sordellii]